MRERVGDRLAKAAAALNTLTPEQRAAVRNALRERVTAEIRILTRCGHPRGQSALRPRGPIFKVSAGALFEFARCRISAMSFRLPALSELTACWVAALPGIG